MTMPLLLPPLSLMLFSDAIKKAKVDDAVTAEADKVQDEDGQQAQVMVLQLSKMQHAIVGQQKWQQCPCSGWETCREG
jgi:hypothetical protein